MLSGKTVIVGGSFNPPNRGHLLVTEYLSSELCAAEVWLVPVKSHPLGKESIDFEHRYQMCKRMVAGMDGVRVSRAEEELGGSGRTVELLEHLMARYPEREFALCVGADILHETSRWHRWDDMVKMVEVGGLGREGAAREGEGGVVLAQAPDFPPISSTSIRSKLAGGERSDQDVPPAVLGYIQEHGLYGAVVAGA